MRKSLLVLKNSVFWFFPKRIFSQSWLGKHFFAFIKEVYQDSIRLKMSHSQFGLFYTKSHLLVSRSGEKSFLGVYEADIVGGRYQIAACQQNRRPVTVQVFQGWIFAKYCKY